jgi:hypothetical protein
MKLKFESQVVSEVISTSRVIIAPVANEILMTIVLVVTQATGMRGRVSSESLFPNCCLVEPPSTP